MLDQKKLKIDYNNYKYAICHFSIKGHNYVTVLVFEIQFRRQQTHINENILN
jgi:hypothetical protein